MSQPGWDRPATGMATGVEWVIRWVYSTSLSLVSSRLKCSLLGCE